MRSLGLIAVLLVAAVPAFAEVSEPTAATPTAPAWLQYVQPQALVKASVTYQLSDVTKQGGQDFDSSKLSPSPYGYRQGFIMENAQFGFNGKFTDTHLTYSVKVEMVPREKDGKPSDSYLRDAWMGWNPVSWLDLRMGWQKMPFSQANLKPAEEFLLPYAPTFDFFTPTRALGLTLTYSDPQGRWKVLGGVHNSVKIAAEQIRDWDQAMYTGRVELNIDKFFGDDAGFKWRLGGGASATQLYFDPPHPRTWLGVDTRLRWRALEVEAEFARVQFKGDTASDGSVPVHTGTGWHTDVAYWILDKQLYVVGRVEQMDGDDLVTDGAGPDIQTLAPQAKRWITGGVGYNLSTRARCVAAFTHKTELEGYSYQNDSGQLTCHIAF